jgi:alpha-beta hydrolase superfamily lysophospholipase
MSVITDQSRPTDEYEAVTVATGDAYSAVFVRRSSRPTRRAVLHLHELADSLAPADLVRWYNERGFHFYLTDVGTEQPGRHRSTRPEPAAFAVIDAAYSHLREQDGIDAIILSAHGRAALIAAQWCDARAASHPVEAVILSDPDFGRDRLRLDITRPVLVISARGPWGGARRPSRGRESVSLGQHVTWLQIDAPGVISPVEMASSPSIGTIPQRRRLFEEMGRWLGAYMYGQLRDQLL